MALIANIQTEYAYQLQDLGSLLEQVNVSPTTDVRDKAIAAAVAYYNRRLPRIKAALIATSVTGAYAVPADWIDSSRIIALEFPIDRVPVPIYMAPTNVFLQLKDDGVWYYLPNPNPNGSFRLLYTGKHGATVALPSETLVGSVPSEHEPILGMMAAARALREYADRCANMVASGIDSVNYRSKSEEFTKAAKEMEDRADKEMQQAEIVFQKKTSTEAYVRGWK